MSQNGKTIEIPLRNSGEEVLEVDLNDLKDNDHAIIDILNQEQVPLRLYLQFSVTRADLAAPPPAMLSLHLASSSTTTGR